MRIRRLSAHESGDDGQRPLCRLARGVCGSPEKCLRFADEEDSLRAPHLIQK
jgi:hypothetical protein